MTVKERYKKEFSDRRFVTSFVAAFSFLIFSFVLNYFLALYAFDRASNSVTDIILSNIPTFNVDALFVWGPLIFWVIVSVFLLRDPKKIPFSLKAVSTFVIIRGCFIALTHLGPFPDHSPLTFFGTDWLVEHMNADPAFFLFFSSGSDLFFSGHTGLPFLLALIFWKNEKMRIFCLASSVFFGIIVLLGHLHYSIDVASAFFITYTIYHISIYLYKNDREKYFGTYTQKS